MPSWKNWLEEWRKVADTSTPTTYVPISFIKNGTAYEVLRVSGYDNHFDADKPHVKNTIKEFNDNIVQLSNRTRDLGIVRVITNKGVPKFVIEPGAEVIDFLAEIEGISVNALMKVMRAGDLGRRVRRRDRVALKNSREEAVAKEAELKHELQDMRSKVMILKQQLAQESSDKAEAIEREEKMRKNLTTQNEQQVSQGMTASGSGTLTCALGTAQTRGTKLTSTIPLPGHFGG